MQVVCLGLLLFSLAWAAPTFQPQTEKTKQGCVEEQRITSKGHHEKHGSYIYVYTAPGRKNQTDMKQEERNKDNIALHHLGKKRKQEPPPKENIVQERKENLFLHEANGKSSQSQNLFTNKQTLNENHNKSNKEKAHNDLNKSIYPESPGNNEAENGNDALSKLHGQEEYSAALVRNNMRHVMGPVTVIKLLGDRKKKNKLRMVLSKTRAGAYYAEASPKGKKNHQRDTHAQKVPVKNKSTHQSQYNTDSLTQLSKVKRIPSDFEGSGDTDLQARGDNNISPFSGDGQPFEDTPGKGGAIFGPDLDHIDVQTGFSGPSEGETPTPDTGAPGYNEIPEKEENGGNAVGTREATREADAAGVSLVEGGNDIIGSTNFKELPGKEGNRVDAGSQNAHQGKVEFHYPHGPSKERKKGGSSGTMESTADNEILKMAKVVLEKVQEHSHKNQVSVHEKQSFSGKSKSQSLLTPSPGFDNEIKNEVGPYNGPNNERNTITHGNGRKNYYIPHRQNTSSWNKGMSQRKGSWNYRKPQSSSNASRSPRKGDSSESSASDSSSESDGD
uniref:Matrix extracellular phosphoglycoprotein n=1 Tax=Dasypus novemcinctus TaxID=9361 RepID=D6C6L3_DASNO|nr:matrix extracellular phosphoglycoprotein [Dasypus novemcinctus]